MIAFRARRMVEMQGNVQLQGCPAETRHVSGRRLLAYRENKNVPRIRLGGLILSVPRVISQQLRLTQDLGPRFRMYSREIAQSPGNRRDGDSGVFRNNVQSNRGAIRNHLQKSLTLFR